MLNVCRSEKAADRLIRRGGPKIFNDLSAGISAGLGYGSMHTVMMYGALIASSTGEAAFYLTECPNFNMFIWTGMCVTTGETPGNCTPVPQVFVVYNCVARVPISRCQDMCKAVNHQCTLDPFLATLLTTFIHTCFAACVALLYNILHITLMIIAIDGFRRVNYLWMAVPFVLHLAFGLLVSV